MNEADGIRLLAYLDGTLPPDEHARVQAWLTVDPEARRLLEQHRRVWVALGEAYAVPDVQPSEDFRRAAVQRARQPEPAAREPRAWYQLTRRAAGLLAASLVAAVALFAWYETSQPPEPWLSPADHDVVANLDMLQSLDFIEKRGTQLDLAGGLEVVAAFDGELPAGSR